MTSPFLDREMSMMTRALERKNKVMDAMQKDMKATHEMVVDLQETVKVCNAIDSP